MVIFEIHSFTHSFTRAVRGSVATQCTGQAASGVNYCYLVVWGSITGTHTQMGRLPEVCSSSRLSLVTTGQKKRKKKKQVYASLIKMSVIRRTLLWTGRVSRAQVSCFYCGAHFSPHCYLYLRQMRPKSWRMDPLIHHSSSWIKLQTREHLSGEERSESLWPRKTSSSLLQQFTHSLRSVVVYVKTADCKGKGFV